MIDSSHPEVLLVGQSDYERVRLDALLMKDDASSKGRVGQHVAVWESLYEIEKGTCL